MLKLYHIPCPINDFTSSQSIVYSYYCFPPLVLFQQLQGGDDSDLDLQFQAVSLNPHFS